MTDTAGGITLTELIRRLEAKAETLRSHHGVDPSTVPAVMWDHRNDDLVPVVGVDYDKFAEDEPWTVEIRKDGDP